MRVEKTMAMIECSECGNKMSEYADICPKCGCPNRLKQARQRAVYEEKRRINEINNTIEYYSDEVIFGVIALIISLLLGYGAFKLNGEKGGLALMFMFSITFFWSHMVMKKFQVGLIASFVLCLLFMMGAVKVLGNTPVIIQNLFVLFLLLYPLYYTIIRPIIYMFKIRREQKKF